MVQISDYDLLTDNDPQRLAQTVRYKISDGRWQPYGSPYVHPTFNTYCQALVRYANKEQKDGSVNYFTGGKSP